MDRLVSVDHERAHITVQAGMTLASLSIFAAEHGLTLPSLGSISAQTVAGLISTGTHGTGLGHGGIAERVVGLKLVSATGEVIAIDERTPDLLHAARLSLGLLEILVEISFACVPAFSLELTVAPATLDDALSDLPKHLEADHFGFWWFPHIDIVALRSSRRGTFDATPPPGRWTDWRTNHWIAGYRYGAELLAAGSNPRLVARANGRLFGDLFAGPCTIAGPSHDVFGVTAHLRHDVIEYAVPIERAAEAIRALQRLLNRGRHICHAPIDVRFTAADTSWLSPAYQRRSCWIGLMIYRPYGRELPWSALFHEIDDLFASMEGRPH